MVRLRPAGWFDAWRLYRWRTDPETARWMRQPPPPSFVAHVRWLRTVLRDGHGSLLLVAYSERDPVGTVRLDRHPPDNTAAEVSITIAPAWRGLGLAALTITALLPVALSWGVTRLVADIQPGNLHSLLAFTRAGFRPLDRKHGWTLERRLLP